MFFDRYTGIAAPDSHELSDTHQGIWLAQGKDIKDAHGKQLMSYDTNNTIVGNSAQNYGGAIQCGDTSLTIVNSILRFDRAYEISAYATDMIDATYCDIQGSWAGEGNMDADPWFADSNNGDYHLKSQGGRWDANDGRWAIDEVTSPCIDAGDPMSPIGLEPFPNGGIINMGAYGGTAEASKSYFGRPPCEIIVAGDVNGDCAIDFKDFFFVALHWLESH